MTETADMTDLEAIRLFVIKANPAPVSLHPFPDRLSTAPDFEAIEDYEED